MTSVSPRRFPKPAAEKSCAASFASSPPAEKSKGTPPPSKTLLSSHNCVARTNDGSVLSKLGFSVGPIWTGHKAFADPKAPGKRQSNEGHGFSRAVKRATLEGFSP